MSKIQDIGRNSLLGLTVAAQTVWYGRDAIDYQADLERLEVRLWALTGSRESSEQLGGLIRAKAVQIGTVTAMSVREALNLLGWEVERRVAMGMPMNEVNSFLESLTSLHDLAKAQLESLLGRPKDLTGHYDHLS